MTNAMLPPSAFGAACFDGTAMHLVGGWDAAGMHSSTWRLDVEQRHFQCISHNPGWTGRSYFPLVHSNGLHHILGGYYENPPSNVLGDVWASRDFQTWEQLTTQAQWEQREAHGALCHNGKLFVFGGVTYLDPEKSVLLGKSSPSHLRLFPDVWESVDGRDWKLTTSFAPWGPRRSFGFASANGFMFVWGGVNDETGTLYNDVWASADGANWEQVLEHAPWRPRMVNNGPGAALGQLWVIGGGVNAQAVVAANDVWASDDGVAWRQLSAGAAFAPRIGAHVAAAQHGGAPCLVLYGGVNDDLPTGRCFYSDLWTSPTGAHWQKLDYTVDGNAPGHDPEHAAA